jgi:hypothetical protein
VSNRELGQKKSWWNICCFSTPTGRWTKKTLEFEARLEFTQPYLKPKLPINCDSHRQYPVLLFSILTYLKNLNWICMYVAKFLILNFRPMPFFSLQTQTMHMKSLYTTALQCFLKKLTSWLDSNPDLLALRLMTTAPRHQGTHCKVFGASSGISLLLSASETFDYLHRIQANEDLQNTFLLGTVT